MLTHEVVKALLRYCVDNKATVTFSFSESLPGSLKVDLRFNWPAHEQIFTNTIIFDNWDLEMMNPDDCQDFINKRFDIATREVYDNVAKGKQCK